MNRDVYELHLPHERTTGVIFASPHSGRRYPPRFVRRSVLDETVLRSSEDAFVDQLFAPAPTHGAPLIAAVAPRAFVDLNRAEDELDPALIEGLPGPLSGARTNSGRVSSGLGVIPRVVSNGRAIYRGKLARDEAEQRLAEVWRPYHAALARLVAQSREAFGVAILIDCHSMPREAIETFPRAGLRRPEVVLGDRFGASAAPWVIEAIEAAFTRTGLRVARNMPFAGAFTAQFYGRPARGQHVVQVEIDRALYMNEQLIRPNNGFDPLCRILAQVIAEIAALGRAPPATVAAE